MAGITKRQMSFADWEMLHQGQTLDPILQAISDFLDNNSTIVDIVQRDLQRGLKNPGTGRDGLTAQQVLRALILKRVKNWDWRELRERIADGISLRQFTDFYSGTVPEHQRFNHAFSRLTPKTVKIVNDLVVKAAVELGLEDGSKLRSDTTVVPDTSARSAYRVAAVDDLRGHDRYPSRCASSPKACSARQGRYSRWQSRVA